MIGKTISHYRIKEKLGQAGIAVVESLVKCIAARQQFRRRKGQDAPLRVLEAHGSRVYKLIVISAVLLLVMLLCGCIPPVPFPRPRKIKGPDLHPIQVGLTTREELARLVGALNTDVQGESFLWARWEEDLPFDVLPTWDGNPRPSKIVNVLALFDSGGILTHYRTCSESKLAECLYYFAARMPSKPSITEPLTLYAQSIQGWGSWSGNIIFDKSKVTLQGFQVRCGTFRCTQETTALDFEVGWDQIEDFKVRYRSSANVLHLSVHFKPKFHRIDYVEIDASPRDAWNLIGASMPENRKHK